MNIPVALKRDRHHTGSPQYYHCPLHHTFRRASPSLRRRTHLRDFIPTRRPARSSPLFLLPPELLLHSRCSPPGLVFPCCDAFIRFHRVNQNVHPSTPGIVLFARRSQYRDRQPHDRRRYAHRKDRSQSSVGDSSKWGPETGILVIMGAVGRR
jgi:hypothetical protein